EGRREWMSRTRHEHGQAQGCLVSRATGCRLLFLGHSRLAVREEPLASCSARLVRRYLMEQHEMLCAEVNSVISIMSDTVWHVAAWCTTRQCCSGQGQWQPHDRWLSFGRCTRQCFSVRGFTVEIRRALRIKPGLILANASRYCFSVCSSFYRAVHR